MKLKFVTIFIKQKKILLYLKKRGGEAVIFEPITENSIELALEIINSNPTYNILENGNPLRSMTEVRSEFLNRLFAIYC